MMTESEWLTSEDAVRMLRFLEQWRITGTKRRLASPRKLRLFAAAVWRIRTKSKTRNDRDVAEMADRFADSGYDADLAAALTWKEESYLPLRSSPREAAMDMAQTGVPAVEKQGSVLRCLFGSNLYKDTPTHEQLRRSGLLDRDGGVVLRLAESIYHNRVKVKCEACDGEGCAIVVRSIKPDVKYKESKCEECNGYGKLDTGLFSLETLAVLSDALEEAGVTDQAMLNHLRGLAECGCESKYDAYTRDCPCEGSGWVKTDRPHFRGCHVIDAILGRS